MARRLDEENRTWIWGEQGWGQWWESSRGAPLSAIKSEGTQEALAATKSQGGTGWRTGGENREAAGWRRTRCRRDEMEMSLRGEGDRVRCS
jgi:hypothetical protein